MKKLIAIFCVLGAATAIFFGWKFYHVSDRNSLLSKAASESKAVWVELLEMSAADVELPYFIQSESGRKYMILSTFADQQRNNEILAVTWYPVVEHQHILIYQSGKTDIHSSEETTKLFLKELMSEEM